jgi:oxygen-dependent protoporphyrinogen oxidase
VTYLPLSVLITTFKKENVKRPLEGFGVLVPSKEQQNGFKTLGNDSISLWLKKTQIGQTISDTTSMMFLHNRYTFFLYDVSRSSTQ